MNSHPWKVVNGASLHSSKQAVQMNPGACPSPQLFLVPSYLFDTVEDKIQNKELPLLS